MIQFHGRRILGAHKFHLERKSVKNYFCNFPKQMSRKRTESLSFQIYYSRARDPLTSTLNSKEISETQMYRLRNLLGN